MPPVAAGERRVPTRPSAARAHEIVVSIGTVAVALQTSHSQFRGILKDRYGEFVAPQAAANFHFDVEITAPKVPPADDDLHVTREREEWRIQRGDIAAGWNSNTRRGWLRQSANPYSADTLLRIVHSIALASEGGFLLHAASCVRSGRAFLFAGESGAGKTTLARLAPPDARVLTDEISYVVKVAHGYRAYGTPFAGELARVGENVSAPVGGLYLLEKAKKNRLDKIDSTVALFTLMRNILFLAQDDEVVQRVFHAAADFVAAVPVYRMHFTPDTRAWDMIE